MGEKEQALAYLKQSLEKGYRQFAHMQTDYDLDLIRNLPEFKNLIDRKSVV